MKILELSSKSAERRLAIVALRKKGNYILSCEKKKVNPVRNPNKRLNIDIDPKQYAPCTTCLGYYKNEYLWRHKKTCKGSKDNVGTKSNHLSDAQTFIVSTGLLGDYLNKSRLKSEVFSIMRPDEISLSAKGDPLICVFGESYINKHKRKQMNVVVSNKMREMARLKLTLQKTTSIIWMIDALKPEMYNHIIAATKIISGYDPERKMFKASSLALHMGTNLKFLCDIARKAIITKDPLFLNVNKNEKLREIEELRDMLVSHWCNDISSLANKVLNEKKNATQKLLPLTEDVQKFNLYVSEMADMAYKKLLANENVKDNYKLLAECTLAIVLVFNRKRIGEVQFLDIDSYEKTVVARNQDEVLSSLTEFEKTMCTNFKRIVVFGKGSKPVSILFTKKMQTYIDSLLMIRKTTEIVPKSNKYIFANPGCADRWMGGSSVLRKFAKKCGATNPDLLTSTKFRKQIATILQLMNCEKVEMEQIARFMGHTEKTHNEFYR